MSEFSRHPARGFRLLCPGCGFALEREEGYFAGAIYINIIATFALILGVAGPMERHPAPALLTQIAVWCLLSVSFPLFFFRYSRGVWLNLDRYFSKKARAPGETGKTVTRED